MSDTAVEVPVTNADQIAALQKDYDMAELRSIADRIGAKSAKKKADLAANIVARADGQGLGYTGYTSAVVKPAPAPEAEASEDTPKAPEVSEEESQLMTNGSDSEPLFDPYAIRIKHFMFTVGDVIDPIAGLLDGPTADAEINRYFQNGYDPVEVLVAGYDTRGQRVGWILEQTKKPRFTEAKHVMRTLVAQADPGRGLITGFQADAYISDLLNDGWELLGVRFNGIDSGPAGSAGGVYMIWFLAR